MNSVIQCHLPKNSAKIAQKRIHQKESSGRKEASFQYTKSNMLLLMLKIFKVELGKNMHGPSSVFFHHLQIPRKSSYHLWRVRLVALLLL